MEMCYAPHAFHDIRKIYNEGYTNPDDIRRLHLSTFYRTNKIKDHYIDKIGETGNSMKHI